MPEFLITDPTAIQVALKERYIAYELASTLKKAYPGRDWLIKVDADGETAAIHCPQISTQWGCVVHLNTDLLTLQRKARYFAGELLERFKMRRDRANDIDQLPKDSLGFTLGLKAGGY